MPVDRVIGGLGEVARALAVCGEDCSFALWMLAVPVAIAFGCLAGGSNVRISGSIFLVAVAGFDLSGSLILVLFTFDDPTRSPALVLAICAAVGLACFGVTWICRARARDAYDDARLWPIGVVPLVSLIFIFKSPRDRAARERVHMNGAVAFVFFAALMGVSRFIEKSQGGGS